MSNRRITGNPDLDNSLMLSLIDCSALMREPLIISSEEVCSYIKRVLRDTLAPTFVINAKSSAKINIKCALNESILVSIYQSSSKYDGFCSIGMCVDVNNTEIKPIMELLDNTLREADSNFIAYFDVFIVRRECDNYSLFKLNFALRTLVMIGSFSKSDIPSEITNFDITIIPVISVIRCILTGLDYGLVLGIIKAGILGERLTKRLQERGYDARLVITRDIEKLLNINDDPYFLAPLAICITRISNSESNI